MNGQSELNKRRAMLCRYFVRRLVAAKGGAGGASVKK